MPAIVVEFVSQSKRDWLRDYVERREEYRGIEVQEYWVVDRFRRQMTVFTPTEEQVYGETDVYQTDLLPGFELSLEALLRTADAWAED